MKRKRKPYRMITKYVLVTLPIKEAIIKKVANIQTGVCEYRSNYALNLQKKSEDVADNRLPLSWKLDEPSESLKVYYEGPKQD